MACDLKGSQVHLVARSLIVKAKVERVAGTRLIADFNQAAFEAIPTKLRDWVNARFRNRVGSV